MRFELIDRIISVTPGESLRAVKALSLAEEYLQDHFPGRPVMPGVMMVEAMVEACAWMVRMETDFAPTVVLLKEARKVVYGQFVRPGDLLVVDVELQKLENGRAHFMGRAAVNGQTVVSGRLELEYFCLAERNARDADIDERLRREMRKRFNVIRPAANGVGVEAPAKTAFA
jgi:3-hydroxyacyl-[acyl-carrier-protein] dehydratase